MSDEPSTTETEETTETTGLSIDDATPDTSVGGGELIPVSDAGSPKCMTVAQVKDYVLARIAALTAAGSASVSSDSVFILQGGVLKPVSASVLAAAIMNEAFGRAAVVGPNGNEVLAIKDSTGRKTITFAALKTWLEDNITVTPDLTLADASNAGTLGDSDLALVVQAASGKKVTLATLKDYVLGKLAAFVTAATAVQSVSSTDVIYLVQGGNMRKATIEQLMSAAGGGDVIAPSTHTAGNIPAWDDTAKKLTSGFGVASSISGSPSATKSPTEAAVANALSNVGDVKKSGTQTNGNLAAWDTSGKVTDGPAVVTSVGSTGADTNVPTEKAVRDAINEAAGVGAPVSHTEGNIPTWGSGNVLADGLSKQISVRNAANASDDAIPTEKAVRDALDGLVAMPSSKTENAIPTWGSGSELKPGLSVVASSTGIASADNASDEKVPTEKAVRAALPGAATTAAAGLMSATDKAKLDNMVDTTAVEEVGDAGLGDSDVLTVLQGGITWKKALITRLWTWIMGKLPTFRIDRLAEGEDNTNLDTNASRHGLCPKLPSSDATDKFLCGDGTFATPAGSTDFTGDTGTGGTHGLVPAPESGDAAANKFLNANGQWTVPPSAAGVDIPGATAIDAAAGADALYCYDDSEGAYRKMTLAQVAALVMGTKRYDNIFIPAAAMVPSDTNGAIAGAISFTNVKRDTMAFSNTTEQGAEFSAVMPEDWDKGTIRAKLLWTAHDATKAEAGEMVAWKIGAISTPDEGAITTAPTNYATVTDNLSQVNELHRTGATGQLSMDGSKGDGNLVHFVVKRNVSAETTNQMDTEALLLGVWIQYGRTAVTEEWS